MTLLILSVIEDTKKRLWRFWYWAQPRARRRYYQVTSPFWRVYTSPRPWRISWLLLFPFPWKFSLQPPRSPRQILRDPSIVVRQMDETFDYEQLRLVALFRWRDTPLRSLYRLYEVMCANVESEVMLESQYFWRNYSWKLEDVPDPKDSDPLRYAILASIVEEMVAAFNWKIELGLRRNAASQTKDERVAAAHAVEKPFERCPERVVGVPPVREAVSFVTGSKDSLKRLLEDPDYALFAKRNIIVDARKLWHL